MTKPAKKSKNSYKSYVVRVQEVHIQKRHVKARTEAEAIKKIADGYGCITEQDGDVEYSHTLDTHTWSVGEDS
jgi:hypothetical protein